jgi:tRNA(fMet)-specific endonuclease VapC
VRIAATRKTTAERATFVYLLDTDMMTLLERDGSGAHHLRARLAMVPLGELATTVVSYEEQTRGWLALMARARSEEDRIAAYARLKRHLEIYCKVQVVDYDDRASAELALLRQARVRGGTNDLRIAAIALANDATLLTRNTSDFDRVPALRVEDWTG